MVSKSLRRLATVLSLISTACMSEVSEPAPEEEGHAVAQPAVGTATAATVPLAELTIGGARITFMELNHGSVVIFSEVRGAAANPLAAPELKGLDFLEIYKRLSGKAPPKALLDAKARRDAVEREPAAPYSLVDDDEGEIPSKTQALTAAKFQTEICRGRKVCEVELTANKEWGEYRTNAAVGVIDFVEATKRLPDQPLARVAVQVRDRRVRDWSNDQYLQVVEGATVSFIYNSPRTAVAFRLKVAVKEVDPGEKYHFTLDW